MEISILPVSMNDLPYSDTSDQPARLGCWSCNRHNSHMPKSLSNTSFVSREPTGGEAAHWVPNTDVFSTEECVVIKVEIAGISKEDLDLTVEGNRMTVSGMRKDEHRSTDCKFQVMEIDYGEFSTSIDVPDGYDIPRAKAAYHNGFLRIEVPKEGSED